MPKIDFKRELKQLYGASAKKVVFADVPCMNFLKVDGQGDPNTSIAFQEAIETLYALSYGLKFMLKKGAAQIDYGVLPLEGLWWAEDMEAFSAGEKGDWLWSLMIMQPEFITADLVGEAIIQLQKKKNPAALPLLRFEPFPEGRAVQTLHIGPFSEEGPTIEKVHDFIHQQGLKRSGKHHEIYLSDTRRAAPEKWRTIIRQPVA